MAVKRDSLKREAALGKLVGSLADLSPEAWERVRNSFEQKDRETRWLQRVAADEDMSLEHKYRNLRL